MVDDFFVTKEFEFVHILKNKETPVKSVAVVCNNLKEFIEFVAQKRGISDFKIKIGLDGGNSFFKVCLSVQANDRIKKNL